MQRTFKYFLFFKSKYHLNTLFSTQNGLKLVEIGDTEDKVMHTSIYAYFEYISIGH